MSQRVFSTKRRPRIKTSEFSTVSDGGMFKSRPFVVQTEVGEERKKSDFKTSLKRAERYGHHIGRMQPARVSSAQTVQRMTEGDKTKEIQQGGPSNSASNAKEDLTTYYGHLAKMQNSQDPGVAQTIHRLTNQMNEIYMESLQNESVELPEKDTYDWLNTQRQNYEDASGNGARIGEQAFDFYGDNKYLRPAGSEQTTYDYPKADVKGEEYNEIINKLRYSPQPIPERKSKTVQPEAMKPTMVAAAVAAEPARYAPAQFTNLLAYANSDRLKDKEGNPMPIFDALTMTTGSTDPQRNAPDERVKDVEPKVTPTALNRQNALISHIFMSRTGKDLSEVIKRGKEKKEGTQKSVEQNAEADKRKNARKMIEILFGEEPATKKTEEKSKQ